MAVLLDLLSPYPILENLISSLAIGDLFNLSKVNSAYRIALHGFEPSCLDQESLIVNKSVRSTLQIGSHRTAFWENLKTRSQLRCSEPHHIRGSSPTGCLICSAPVCEACIIKASFAKRNENTFQKRHRPLCSQCWYTGNHHKKHPIQLVGTKTRKPYPAQAADGELCICTARNGHLCLDCKKKQNAEPTNGSETCYGEDCTYGGSGGKGTSMEGRVCLWCSRQLPGSRSRAESRRSYDSRHLLARTISTYDRSPEDDDLGSFEAQRMLESDTLSRTSQRDMTGGTNSAGTPDGAHVPELVGHDRELDISQRSEVLSGPEVPLLSTGWRNAMSLPRYEAQQTTLQNATNR